MCKLSLGPAKSPMGHLLYPSLSNALTGEQPLVIHLLPQQFGSNMHRWAVGCVW